MTAAVSPADAVSDPAELVSDLSRGHIVARCLHIIAECGAADVIGAGGATPAAIAGRTGLTADALDRMLRLLASHGIFAHGPGGTYRHTPASETLRTDHPRSLRAYVRMAGMPAYWDRFTELPQTARTGHPRYDMAGFVEYCAAHPEESAVFNAAMVTKARTVLPAVVAAYDFNSCGTIADVGGGRGHLLRMILEHAPAARGILFDRAHVLVDSEEAPRLTQASGDFFVDALPAADLYLLMDVLHDWGDADAARILKAVRRAARPAARLLIIETLVPEAPGPHFGKVVDVIMLAVTGGRERSAAQHAALLAATGFRFERELPTASHYSIVEATTI
jgi:hypothetical protein